jgi:TonB family protein
MNIRTSALALLALALSPATEIHALPKHEPLSSFSTEILTDREGVDFTQIVKEVCLSVSHAWFANMPPAVLLGEEGVNTIEFRILRDGGIPKEFVKITHLSGKDILDAASLRAIREAAPVSHLPEKFTQPFIVMRFNFYYNERQWQAGKVSDTSGTATTSGDTTYAIDAGDYIYECQEHIKWKWSKPARFTVNGPVQFAIEKDRIYIKSEDGSEHETKIIKKILKTKPEGAN